ncbi:IBR domain-containing protein [Colletotrichum graminicola]|nr:IBR domain-containing protein [Colletotrichum graminicola]
MLMDAMDAYSLSPCPRCRRIIELAAGCHHMTCPCGYEFCFQCGGAWHGGCTRGCGLYPQEGQNRVPVRERDGRYHQGQNPDDFPAIVRQEGVPQPEPLPQPLPLPGPEPVPQEQPMQLPQAGLFRPQADDGLWEPIPPELLQAMHQQRFQMMDWPYMEDMQREDRNRQGRGRYSIVMYYTDGSNTEPENRNWRADPRAHRRRPQEGARAWPIFEIHPEDPQCNHHLPTSWEVENMNNRPMPPQCIFCRSRDGAVYFRCQVCGVVACSMHNTTRFGLTWAQAVMIRQRLQDRVWIEEPRHRRGESFSWW